MRYQLDVPPNLSIADPVDDRLVDLESSRQSTAAHSACEIGENYRDVGLGQFCHAVIAAARHLIGMNVGPVSITVSHALGMRLGAMRVSARRPFRMKPQSVSIPSRNPFRVRPRAVSVPACSASLQPHVFAVLGRVTEEQVGQPHAPRVVAMVADERAFFDWSVGQHPRYSMGLDVLSVDAKPSIALSGSHVPACSPRVAAADVSVLRGIWDRAVLRDLGLEAFSDRLSGSHVAPPECDWVRSGRRKNVGRFAHLTTGGV